jgi:hypothetical protein
MVVKSAAEFVYSGLGKDRCCKSGPQIGPFLAMLVRIAYRFGSAPDENCSPLSHWVYNGRPFRSQKGDSGLCEVSPWRFWCWAEQATSAVTRRARRRAPPSFAIPGKRRRLAGHQSGNRPGTFCSRSHPGSGKRHWTDGSANDRTAAAGRSSGSGGRSGEGSKSAGMDRQTQFRRPRLECVDLDAENLDRLNNRR